MRRTTWGKKAREFTTDSVGFRQASSLVIRLNGPEEVELDGDPFGESIRPPKPETKTGRAIIIREDGDRRDTSAPAVRRAHRGAVLGQSRCCGVDSL